MQVKQAVETAKQYVSDLFADEKLVGLGLEEVEYNDSTDTWYITLGWDRQLGGPLAKWSTLVAGPRAYKVAAVSSDGRVLSVKNREVKA